MNNKFNPEAIFGSQLNMNMNSNKIHFSTKEMDFALSGQPAQVLISSLIEIYKQNGGKNFLTMTFGDEDGKYEVTIQKSGKLTPGEKLQQLNEQNVELIDQVQQLEQLLTEVGLQAVARIGELEETLQELAEIDQQIEFLQILKLRKYEKAFSME